MGPKKDAKDENKEPAIGAKFAYIVVGQRSNLCKHTVNLNCNIEILLDYSKKALLKKLEERITALKAANVVEGNAAEAPVNPNDSAIQKLIEFQSYITNDSGDIDLLNSAGAPVGCNLVSKVVFVYLC